MNFRIADTFTDSLAALTAVQQTAVKTTAFDLQLDPSNPGMQYHRLDRSRDPNFWSVRVNRDMRIIVHRTKESLLLCYVGHHEEAYGWAARRKIERHPTTGAAQLVEVRETVQEVVVPTYVYAEPEAPAPRPLFADVPYGDFLRYGVPPEWIDQVREATESTLLDMTEHLPGEAAEALLQLATGETPRLPAVALAEAGPFAAREVSPRATADSVRSSSAPRVRASSGTVRTQLDAKAFEHPDAQRRFRTIESVEELERALEFPWERWTVFLHPSQRELVERSYSGPARVSGSAGTGKTIVALHRAVWLARSNPDARVLLTTFSDTLANALRFRLRYLIGNEPRIAERLEVHAMGAIGRRLYASNFGAPNLATSDQIRAFLREAVSDDAGRKFGEHFVWTEWSSVVDAWQLESWEEYRDVKRLGRRTRLPENQRATLWSIFEKVRTRLASEGLITEAGMFRRLATKVGESGRYPYDFIVVDEAQDISVPELRFLAALGGGRPNSLFFAGDLGQRIFQQPFSWSSLGVEIRGRSTGLRVNYRTSHQIRSQADRLLAPEIADVDGIVEDRRGTISVFNGPPPLVQTFQSEEDESAAVGAWISKRLEDGYEPHEIAVFVRSPAQIPRAESAAREVGATYRILDEAMDTHRGELSVTTMHLAKGLEFRAVAVMACDEDVIPLQERIESAADGSDLEDVYATERHLLYVACTRARDSLFVSGVEPGSEFLEDMRPGSPGQLSIQ
ncbi:MAG: 3'-5' exonuclease [Acidobacteriota bacterium]